MKFVAFALALVGCVVNTSSQTQGVDTTDCANACDAAYVECSAPLHSICAHCCEAHDQTFCNEGVSANDQTCFVDCENASDATCSPARDACVSACGNGS